MQESFSNEYQNWHRHEIFAQTHVPPQTSFFVRLDGWKFKKTSGEIETEKPFDEKFARCLISSGKTIYKKGFSPALIYAASDELNILFLGKAPFRGRVEKINSVLAGLVSSTFTLELQKHFGKNVIASFDSRIVVLINEENVFTYLAWRQNNTWRNYNNAYAYWVLSRTGYKPKEISKMLKGLKTREIHEIVFKQGFNLAKTPLWQRRGILVYKEPYLKKAGKCLTVRQKIRENWNLPLFTKNDGVRLIKQIMKWTKQKEENKCQYAKMLIK